MTPTAAPPAGTIPPGVWLVGAQIQFGTYQSTAPAGASCYWAKLRDFRHTVHSFSNASLSSRRVPIGRDDTGFYTNGTCGTWTRIGPAPDE